MRPLSKYSKKLKEILENKEALVSEIKQTKKESAYSDERDYFKAQERNSRKENAEILRSEQEAEKLRQENENLKADRTLKKNFSIATFIFMIIYIIVDFCSLPKYPNLSDNGWYWFDHFSVVPTI